MATCDQSHPIAAISRHIDNRVRHKFNCYQRRRISPRSSVACLWSIWLVHLSSMATTAIFISLRWTQGHDFRRDIISRAPLIQFPEYKSTENTGNMIILQHDNSSLTQEPKRKSPKVYHLSLPLNNSSDASCKVKGLGERILRRRTS